jgi:hypothetical protein
MSRSKTIDKAIWQGPPIWPEFEERSTTSRYRNSSSERDQSCRTFLNERYEVLMFALDGGVTWLSIKRRKKEAVHDWRELQAIKNSLCGPNREGFEIYPGDWRVIDTANSYHLFVLPEGKGLSVGWVYRDVSNNFEDSYTENVGRQRPLPSWMKEGTLGIDPDDPAAPAPIAEPVDADGNLQLVFDLVFKED